MANKIDRQQPCRRAHPRPSRAFRSSPAPSPYCARSEGEPEGLSLGQIAQRVGLARSTVQRIVDALRAEQFVIAASPTAGVRLGPALIRLAASASVEFDHITRPIMAELSQELGETVDLSVLKGNSAVFTDQIQGRHRLRAVSAIGESFPLHCTANGKALLRSCQPKSCSGCYAGRYPD